MNDSANRPQTALLVGRTSDIAVAILEQLTTLRVVVLAARDLERASLAAEKLKSTNAGLSVTSVHFEALDVATHAQLIQDAVRQVGDIDVVMVACGALGSPDAGTGPLEHHHQAMEVTHATYVAPLSIMHAAAQRLHERGHGSLIVISSAATLRPRRTNPVYGTAKAGIDAFTLALADRLSVSGVHVMLVRPGFVRTSMTEGLTAPLMSATPQRVAADVGVRIRRKRPIVWSPRAGGIPDHSARLLPATIVGPVSW